MDLSLKVLDSAKICNGDCFEKLDDGSINKLLPASIVSCVGCGRKCHMECHRVPKSLSEAIKIVPKNNRVNAFFNECSYMRLVCDNCANWLMADVPSGSAPSFLAMFSRIADKIIKEKYVLKKDTENMEVVSEPVAYSGLNVRKRKKISEDNIEETDLLTEMRKMMSSCFEKMENIDKKIEINAKTIDVGFSALKDVAIKNTDSMMRKFDTIGESVHTMNSRLSDIDGKIDSKHVDIENGLQEGFNNLISKTEILLSPMTPKSHLGRGDHLRKRAFMNSARNLSRTPNMNTYSRVVMNSVVIPGSSTNDDIFGAVVPRRLFNGDNVSNSNNDLRGFRHEKAICLRYVDPLITPTKIMQILTKNSTINEALNNDNNCMEITRLTKKNLSNDEIKSLKYGVSYRIGANDPIFDVIMGGSLFAPHWAIAKWVDKDRKRFRRPESELHDSLINIDNDTTNNFLVNVDTRPTN